MWYDETFTVAVAVTPRSIRLRILKAVSHIEYNRDMASYTALDPLEDTESTVVTGVEIPVTR